MVSRRLRQLKLGEQLHVPAHHFSREAFIFLVMYNALFCVRTHSVLAHIGLCMPLLVPLAL